jgi:ABC-type glycerol-3-phosphate transport system substrate-binding protein
MRKTVKKLAAVGLSLTSVMGLVACGSNSTTTTSNGTEAAKEITQPTKFTVMCDSTVVIEDNGGKEFYAYLKSLLGDGTIDITWIRPDHSNYSDGVASAFASGDIPDVVLLPNDYYALYASSGYLWDMTDAWENSNTKNSGRLTSTAQNVIDSMYVLGLDGQKRMYGFTPARGNGCCTYVKKTWIEAAGYNVSDIEGKTLTFDEYYTMLKKMKDAKNSVVISAPGFISTEAPYTNYLPEFYQKAQFSFYKGTDGKYVDGFSEKAMEEALTRIQTAVADGVLDQESINNSTANARDKFYEDKSGVFTYWAGTWADTLKNNLTTKGLDGTLIALNPIKELGTYVERLTPAWCITTSAENPEGIFKYFIDTMLDGGEVQKAWEYGAKGTHWDDKAETVTLQGKEDSPTTYAEGEFHFLPSPQKPSTLVSKNHIDPNLALATFEGGEEARPDKAKATENVLTNAAFFFANSTVAESVPYTEEMGDNINDINSSRTQVIADVAMGKISAADGIARYKSEVGTKVETVLKSLNN